MSQLERAGLRADVVEGSIVEALDAITTLFPDISSGELATAIFTLCGRVVRYSIDVKDPIARQANVETARTAIGQLYTMLPKVTNAH